MKKKRGGFTALQDVVRALVADPVLLAPVVLTVVVATILGVIVLAIFH